MVGLLDIAPVARKVDIRGTTLSVKGLSLKAFRDLIVAFPDVATMLAGKPDAGALIMQAPEAVAAIIAAGLGRPEEAEQVSELVVDDQLALLTPIVELTLPNGIGPFVALMERMGAGRSGGAAPAMRGPDMNSPPPPPASSEPDTTKKK